LPGEILGLEVLRTYESAEAFVARSTDNDPPFMNATEKDLGEGSAGSVLRRIRKRVP
jgi:hypothetical protein